MYLWTRKLIRIMESGILDWVLLKRVLPSVLAGEDSVSVIPRSKLLTGDMEGSKCTY